MKVEFISYNLNSEIPERAYDTDTGADIKMMYDGEVAPQCTKVIPAGFGIKIPNGYSARLQVRTSIAKEGIIVQGCAIDATYDGEIHMIIHNVSNKTFKWKAGNRLCYIEIYPCIYADFVDSYDMRNRKQRKNNCFGSTGK